MPRATLLSAPASPMAVYRPMALRFQREIYSPAQVAFIRPADASDVSTLGNGLTVGDILVKHATMDTDAPALIEGQTVLLTNCGEYSGVREVRFAFTVGSDRYMVIDAPNYGSVTPGSPSGTVVVWLDNYTIWLKLLVYLNLGGSPTEIIVRGQPYGSGIVEFNIDKYLKNEFNLRNLPTYCLPVGGGELVQSAHGLTALFYRIHAAEVYDVPGEDGVPDPFDGEHDVLVDDTEDVSTYRVCVNAVHPYADWAMAGFDPYVVGASTSRFLTQAPRETLVSTTVGVRRTMEESDRFRIHMLTSSSAVGDADPYKCDFILRVREVLPDGSSSEVLSKDIILSGLTTSFSVAVGPADLAPFILVPDRYRAYVSNSAEAVLSEPIDITVDRKCKENRTPMACLNLLGGVDHYTFTGRLFDEAKNGEAAFRVSSAPLSKQDRAWLAALFGKRGKTAVAQTNYASGTGNSYTRRSYRGAFVYQRLGDTLVAPVIITNDIGVAFSSGPYHKPITMEYSLGVDNISQEG